MLSQKAGLYQEKCTGGVKNVGEGEGWCMHRIEWCGGGDGVTTLFTEPLNTELPNLPSCPQEH